MLLSSTIITALTALPRVIAQPLGREHLGKTSTNATTVTRATAPPIRFATHLALSIMVIGVPHAHPAKSVIAQPLGREHLGKTSTNAATVTRATAPPIRFATHLALSIMVIGVPHAHYLLVHATLRMQALLDTISTHAMTVQVRFVLPAKSVIQRAASSKETGNLVAKRLVFATKWVSFII